MTDRHFRVLLGISLLACLYYGQQPILAGVIGFLVFEGLTNWRLPLLITRLSGTASIEEQGVLIEPSTRFDFAAERLMRLLIAGMLYLSVFLFQQPLWWVAWFIGFAQLGAGISGVCPVLSALRVLGFR